MHGRNVKIGLENGAQSVAAPEEEEYGGSPSGGGDVWKIVDGIV